jgi:hypothetical protein
MKLLALNLIMATAMALPQGEFTEGKGVKPGANMISTLGALLDRNGQLDGGFGPKIRNELIDSTPCGDIIFIFARASMEPQNMVLQLLTAPHSHETNIFRAAPWDLSFATV